MSMNRKQYLALACMLLIAHLPCWGQSTNQGAIVGTVTDESGEVITGAKVTALNIDTQVTRQTVSSEHGDYRLDFLLPGRYQVTAERSGFKKTTVTDLELQVGQARRVDLRLAVGEISGQITVSSNEAAINTESPALGEVIDNQKIQNLPLNGREFIQLGALVPGAESGNPKRGAIYSKGYSIGFNGARAGYNAYYLDGADSTDGNTNQLISSPSLDAIKEFRVETSMYSVQYGRSGGGVISVVTNSGSNQFHGTLYEYHRNKALDALPVFATGSREAQPSYLFNQFGGSVGGPIRKGKTFFFFSAEGFRQKKPGQLITTFAPTAKERIGDLSETINPFTGLPVVLKNPFTGELIPDNKVPANLINPVGKRLMDLWPEPNYSGDPFLNLRIFRSGTFNQNKWLARVDHHFSERDTLSATFNYGNYDNISPSHTPYGDINGLGYDRTLVVTHTHTFSNTIVNDLKFNYTHYRAGGDFALNDKNYAKEWGLWSGTNSPSLGSPRILMYTVGFQVFSLGNAGGYLYKNRHAYIKDNLVWVNGQHTVLIGGEFKHQPFDWMFNDGVPATYYFGLYDGLPSLDSTYGVSGSTFSSLLMGTTARTIYGLTNGDFMKLRRNTFSLYLQDDWKVTPRLTLNLGVRYEYEAPFASATNEFLSLNFETGLPRYAKGAPADKLALLQFPYETDGPNRPFEPNKLNFAPRVGFAFRPFNDNRTVVRGGYGLFYTSETAYTTIYGAWVIPFRGQFDYFSRAFNWPDGMDHFVTIDKEPYEFGSTLGRRNPGFFLPNSPDYPTGYLQQWNLTIGREIGSGLALEAAYVGSKGTNLNGASSVFQYSPELSAKVEQKLPGWSLGLRTKGFNSKYHAMQLKATKRLSDGLHFLASFTWGHALAESSNDETNENFLNDRTALDNIILRRYSNADFDVRKRFSLSGGYDLPFGRNKAIGSNWNGFLDSLLGGWQLNFILTLQDGYPFTVYNSSLRFPDRICDGNLPASQRTADRWYDFSCFPDHQSTIVTGPNGQSREINIHGNAAPNSIVGPGQQNLDLSLQKNFRITEGSRLQFRFEAFNALNHPNLIGPSGNYFFNSASGAKITRARDNRDIQLALKFIF